MKVIGLALILALINGCLAAEVGIFEDSKLTSPVYNVETGSYMAGLRAIWNPRGAIWRQTSVLSTQFLSTVDILYLAHFRGPSITPAEQSALVQWVHDGGTLIFFGDCG